VRDKPDLKKATAMTISWKRFTDNGFPVKPGGCEFVSFESIRQCLLTGHYEDASSPQTKYSHHAARIAWLIKYIEETGNVLDPIHIHINRRKAYIFDGSHRLRAYQFLHMSDSMPVLVTGHMELIRDYASIPFACPSGGS
jgi:ParB-like nuclease family protein